MKTENKKDNSNTEEKDALSKAGRIGALLTTAILVWSILLHFFGQVAYNAYLTTWGVEPGVFPKSLDWYSLYGYYTVANRTIDLAAAIFRDGALVMTLAAGVLVIVLFLALQNSAAKKSAEPKKQPAWANRLPGWLRKIVLHLTVTAIFTSLIPLTLTAAGILLVMPGLVGESFGKVTADAEYKEFHQGCENAKKAKCIEIKKGEKTVAKGFGIESSPTHIALYDPILNRVTVLERAGLETQFDMTTKTLK